MRGSGQDRNGNYYNNSGYGSNYNQNSGGSAHRGQVRNSAPVAPENSALADELRRVLKGKRDDSFVE